MTMEQVRNLTAEAANQVLGASYFKIDGEYVPTTEYITKLDTSKLVDLGKAVSSVENGVENFTHALIDVIATYMISDRKYVGERPDIFVLREMWGAYIEQINFDLNEIIEDEMWSLQDRAFINDKLYYQPRVVAKIFGDHSALCVPYSRGRKQLMSAFKSWEDLGRFIAGLELAVTNTVEFCYEIYAKMVISTACAVSIAPTALNNAVHLLTEYNTKYSKSLTADTALEDKDFLIYMMKRIKKVERLASCMGSQFNDGSVQTFTNEEDKRLVLLGDVVDAIKFNLKANTYHDNEIGIGDYKQLSCWQGKKTLGASKYSFTITTNLGSGDVITINGKDFTEGVNFDAGDTAADTAAALVTRINASDNPKVTGYTWTSDGAKVIAETKADHYLDGAITAKMGAGATGVISTVSTDVDGRSSMDFKDLSTISIAGSEKFPFGENGITQNYVVGLFYDIRAISACVFENYTTSSFNARADFYNFFQHLKMQYMINPSFSMVSFVLD